MTGIKYSTRSTPAAVPRPGWGHRTSQNDAKPTNGEILNAGFEPWGFIGLILRRWHWILLCGIVLSAAGIYSGTKLFHPTYSASVKLLRTGGDQNNADFYRPRLFSEQTYGAILRGPELLHRVATQAKPEFNSRDIDRALLVTPVRDSEIVLASVSAGNPKTAVELANLYAREAVRYTRELQAQEARQINESFKAQLAQMDGDVQALNEQFRTAPTASLLQAAGRVSLLEERLQLAREELYGLLAKYTDLHPQVQEQRAKIAVLEKQLMDAMKQPGGQLALPLPTGRTTVGSLQQTNTTTARQTNSLNAKAPTAQGVTQKPGVRGSSDVMLSQLQALTAARMTLASRQREAQIYTENPPGYVQVLAPAALSEVEKKGTRIQVLFLGILGFALGIGGSMLLVMLVEVMDDRLKTADDLKRVTRLPVLASLGDLKRMSHSAQSVWAFRTWTALQSRLSPSANHGLICGVTSSTPGEGRSTWINLLAQAASECGFRVLTVATVEPKWPDGQPREDGEVSIVSEGDPESPTNQTSDSGPCTSLTTTVLSSPYLVTEKLTSGQPQPYVHIPLPGWVWNLERRKQWHDALSQWSRIDNLVILVKLPPASTPEAVLLAENLPNLLWLSDGRKTRAGAVREQLQTLREARCHLVGAVLNHDFGPTLKRRFSRWVGGWMAFAALGFGLAQTALAQDATPAFVPSLEAASTRPQSQTNLPAGAVAVSPAPTVSLAGKQTNTPPRTIRSFSIISPSQKAAWQQRLTLGPGDILNFALFGQPDLSRTEVLIGPDGRVSYLQAEVQAAGLTVDELRQKLDEELGKYYRSPRTIIIPVAFRSKKYYVLGKVVNRGVYLLDQPLTLVEAVARAKGLETGLVDFRNTVELADLSRSFVVRQGKRLPVDFEKLFQAGDLSQNVAIEPEDYLYFASVNLKEVYVLGEVNSPGPVTYMPNTTVIGAISARAGFTDKAYKGKVLVVRGSLNRPQTFIVDVFGALEAKTFNFKLEPKDIVYVAHRPFIRVEEVLDLAATAFIQSAMSAWAIDKVGPIITSPILP